MGSVTRPPPAGGRMGVALVCGGLSGVLLWLASPPVGIAPLAWVAIVPAAAVALAGRSDAARLAVPLAYGVYLELLLVPALPFGLAEGQFGDPVLPVLVGGSPAIVVALVAIPLFAAALYLVRFGTPWGADRMPGSVGVIAAIIVPALMWSALDFARVNLDPAGSWGPLYHSQAATFPGDLAALGGPWLLTFLIVLSNYALACAIVRRSARLVAVPVTILLLAAAVGGPEQGDRVLRVAAVQPGYDTANEDRPELRRFEPGTYAQAALDLIRVLAGPTREAAGNGADLVVWPEAVMFVDPRKEPRVREALSDVARDARVAIVVGWFDRATKHSAATLVGGDGDLAPAQPKQRPTWVIGEQALDVPAEPVVAGDLRVGILLGLDMQDPGVAAALADRGADVLASTTHDWEQLATQQRASSQITARAVGIPVVRADWRYGSAVYASDGEHVVDAGTERREALVVAEVRPGRPRSYAHSGDLVGWLAVAFTALALAAVTALRFRLDA